MTDVRAGVRSVVWVFVCVAALGGCEGDGGAPPLSPVAPGPPTPVSPTPPTPAPEPPAPPGAVPPTEGDGRVIARWAAPADPILQTPITHYEVRLFPRGGPPPDAWIRVPNTSYEHEFTGLTNGQTYVIEVRSVDDRGTPADPADDLYSASLLVTATPESKTPPVPAKTWFGFADRRVSLIEGGRVQLALPFSGEPIDHQEVPGFPVNVASDAPRSELQWSYVTEDDFGTGHYLIDLRAVRDEVAETPASYEITLDPLQPGVGISPGAGMLQVMVRDAAPGPGCSTLDITSSGHGRGPADDVWTGEFVFEGPESAALRLVRPYGTLKAHFPEDPPLAVISPVRLPYEELPNAGHRQPFTLHWSGELALTAVTSGCEPVSLVCNDGSGGCTR